MGEVLLFTLIDLREQPLHSQFNSVLSRTEYTVTFWPRIHYFQQERYVNVRNTVTPRLTKIIRSGITFVSRNLR